MALLSPFCDNVEWGDDVMAVRGKRAGKREGGIYARQDWYALPYAGLCTRAETMPAGCTLLYACLAPE